MKTEKVRNKQIQPKYRQVDRKKKELFLVGLHPNWRVELCVMF